jgi:hypothetical protein
MQGDDVGLLQDDLRRRVAAISFDEADTKTFGVTTREAVLEFQKAAGLATTGIVDEWTAAALAADVEELSATGRGFLVYGRIQGGDGALTVRAFDRDLRSEELLGEVTVSNGIYEIGFTAEQFSRAEKARADILVRVSNPAGLPLAESSVFFNGPPVARVDLVIGDGAARGPSEYESLVAEITPLLQGLGVTDLVEDDTNQDVTFLAGETGEDPARIALLILSQRLKQRTLPAEVFYGLFREGLPTRLSALLAQRPEVLTRALVRAAERSIVPAAIGEKAEEYVDGLRMLVAGLALEQPTADGRAAPAEVLRIALPDPDMHLDFLETYLGHTGPIQDFWANLRGRPEYEKHIDDLQTTLHLVSLTGNHLPLVQRLAGMRDEGEFTDLADLARLSVDDWTKILASDNGGSPVGVPPGVPGDSDAAKTRTYARALANRVEDAFPQQYVRHRLENDETVPGRDNLRAFLDANPDFDLRATRLDSYLSAHPTAMDAVPDPGAAPLQIKALQRIYRLAPRYAEASALLKAGITSAHAITRMGFNVFRETLAQALQADEG